MGLRVNGTWMPDHFDHFVVVLPQSQCTSETLDVTTDFWQVLLLQLNLTSIPKKPVPQEKLKRDGCPIQELTFQLNDRVHLTILMVYHNIWVRSLSRKSDSPVTEQSDLCGQNADSPEHVHINGSSSGKLHGEKFSSIKALLQLFRGHEGTLGSVPAAGIIEDFTSYLTKVITWTYRYEMRIFGMNTRPRAKVQHQPNIFFLLVVT